MLPRLRSGAWTFQTLQHSPDIPLLSLWEWKNLGEIKRPPYMPLELDFLI